MPPLEIDKERGRIINTKGCCFICLQRVSIRDEELNSSSSRSQISHLFRYLKVDVNFEKLEMDIPPDPLMEVGSYNTTRTWNGNVEAELCDECIKINKRVSKLVQLIATLKMEMNYYLSSIHKNISESGRTPSRMMRYHRRMERDINSFSSIEDVDHLRKQLSEKCSKITSNSQPTVVVKRIDLNHYFREFNSAEANYPPSPSQEEAEIEDNNDRDDDPYLKTLVKIETHQVPESQPLSMPPPELILIPVKIKKGLPLLLPKPTVESNVSVIPTPTTNPIAQSSKLNAFVCNICHLKFSNKASLMLHDRVTHQMPRKKCSYCNQTFSSESKIYEPHVKRCAHAQSPDYSKTNTTCSDCGRVFIYVSELRFHRKTEHGKVDFSSFPQVRVKEHKCNICDKVFREKYRLRNHHDSVHLRIRYRCTFPACKRKFSARYKLLRHQKLDHGEILPVLTTFNHNSNTDSKTAPENPMANTIVSISKQEIVIDNMITADLETCSANKSSETPALISAIVSAFPLQF